jgi:hypothetical protein
VKRGEHQRNGIIRPRVAIDDQAVLAHVGSIDELPAGGVSWRVLPGRAQ